MNNYDALVTIEHPELARLLGLEDCKDQKQAIRRLARAKRIPVIKMGGVFRFSIPAIQKWIDAQFADQIAPVTEKSGTK